MRRVDPPTLADIRAAREHARHSQRDAGSVVYQTERRWRAWELGESRMPLASWELYLIRTQGRVSREPPQVKKPETKC